MGLGGTAKKLQKVMDAAEQLYSKMNEIIGELKDLQGEVESTSEQVDRIERDLARQRAVLEAIANQQGIDVAQVIDDADLPEEGEGSEDVDSSGGEEDNTTIYVSDDE
jgi:DNA anti-recombination protein RmuC